MNVGIYCRVSTEGQREEKTIEAQERIAYEWLKQNPDYDAEFYKDDGISGAEEIENRPALKRLIEKITQGYINYIWVFSTSRLARDAFIKGQLIRIFQKHKTIVCVDGRDYDLNKPDDALAFEMLGSFDTHHRAVIKINTMAGKAKKRDKGELAVARIFGYARSNLNETGEWKWMLIPEKARLIREMYNLILSGKNTRQAIKTVYSTYDIKEIDKQTKYWYNILRRPEYCGFTYDTKGKLIESKIYTQRIVSREEFLEVVKRMEENKCSNKKQFTGKRTSTGIVECGTCGLKYYYNWRSLKGFTYSYYSHKGSDLGEKRACNVKNSFKAETIDTAFTSLYYMANIFHLYRGVMQNTIEEDMQGDIKKSETEIDLLTSELKTVQQQKFNLTVKISKGILDDEDCRELMAEVKSKITTIQEKIDRIKNEDIASEKANLDFLKNRSIDKIKNFMRFPVPAKNVELRKFLKKAIVVGEEIYILTSSNEGFVIPEMTKKEMELLKKYTETVESIIISYKDNDKIAEKLLDDTLSIVAFFSKEAFGKKDLFRKMFDAFTGKHNITIYEEEK